ncbi:hypothetical protein [Flavobacterium sp.]|jgi:hypothetical protein|uniref:hypothetical protein n=1 Tax=Flavobacterium sp. TaxID=239 RepID=UPI0037BEA801
MKSFYSIVRFVNNPLSKENLAIGLIVLSNKNIHFKFSQEKIQLINKINPDNFKLLEYSISKINYFINSELKKEVSLFSDNVDLNVEYLNRLSIYNNGFLQFDKPLSINMDFNSSSFESFFKNYIELSVKKVTKEIVDVKFKQVIDRVFSKPLNNIINIDYRVKKKEIPGLYFDYTLDGIGANDIVYSVKSIDLNAEKPIEQIRKDISEFESLNYRIDLFSKSLGMNEKDNKHYLIIDEYQGNKTPYKQLYDILAEQKIDEYPYKIISSNKLTSVTTEIKNSNSKKFSDLL